MIIVLSSDAQEAQISSLSAFLEGRGLDIHISRGVEHTVVGCIGAVDEDKKNLAEQLNALPYVDRVVIISKPYKMVGRGVAPEGSRIHVKDVCIGGDDIVVMAGPCAIENEQMMWDTAKAVKAAGANILSGGAFKPSTSPYAFHGMGQTGLKILAEVGQGLDMPVVTEVMDTRDVEMVSQYADILQIGTRNMSNFSLLQEVGRTGKPVLLKRGWASLVEEWLLAAEYIALRGNFQIILCERGIRSFETYTRNSFDINGLIAAKQLSHLPVIADPSHATGRAKMVPPLSCAAIAAGADGIIVEVHPCPQKALNDGAQSLDFDAFHQMIEQLKPVAKAVGRKVADGS